MDRTKGKGESRRGMFDLLKRTRGNKRPKSDRKAPCGTSTCMLKSSGLFCWTSCRKCCEILFYFPIVLILSFSMGIHVLPLSVTVALLHVLAFHKIEFSLMKTGNCWCGCRSDRNIINKYNFRVQMEQLKLDCEWQWTFLLKWQHKLSTSFIP